MSSLGIGNRSRVPRVFERAVRELARRLAVGKNVEFGIDFRVGRRAIVSAPHKLTIGNWVCIGPNSIVQVNGSIGDFALIGMGVQIVGKNDHRFDVPGVPMVLGEWVGDRPPRPDDAVTIGRDVWIGGSTTILSGCSIGEGSIIGSGSVVTKNIPPNSIAVGNPARVVKQRFETPALFDDHRHILDELSIERTSGD